MSPVTADADNQQILRQVVGHYHQMGSARRRLQAR
jgi:hypothetical protein